MSYRISRLSLALILPSLTLLAVACGGSSPKPVFSPDDPARPSDNQPVAATTPNPLEGIQVPVEFARRSGTEWIVRSEDSLTVEIEQLLPRTREVGSSFSLETASLVRQEFWTLKAEYFVSGAIETVPSGGIESVVFENTGPLVDLNGLRFRLDTMLLTCTRVGTGSYTVKVTQWINDENGNPVDNGTTVTVDGIVECVASVGEPGFSFSDFTDDALGFSQNSLNWVAFEQGDIVLRVNQIEPVELEVGQTADIYADFDARNRMFDDLARWLSDATLEFSGGGPIRIDSPLAGQPDNITQRLDGNDLVVWGFRSGAITCVGEGEGVYSATLTGFMSDGSTITQIVSGLVNCESPPVTVITEQALVFAVVFTMDGRPYDQAQFRVEDSHDECVFRHVHSDVTVFPYREWFGRSGASGPLNMTGEGPLTDPEPQKCGYGPGREVSGSRITQPSTIQPPVSAAVAFCDEAQFDLIVPASESQAITVDRAISNCNAWRELAKQ